MPGPRELHSVSFIPRSRHCPYLRCVGLEVTWITILPIALHIHNEYLWIFLISHAPCDQSTKITLCSVLVYCLFLFVCFDCDPLHKVRCRIFWMPLGWHSESISILSALRFYIFRPGMFSLCHCYLQLPYRNTNASGSLITCPSKFQARAHPRFAVGYLVSWIL